MAKKRKVIHEYKQVDSKEVVCHEEQRYMCMSDHTLRETNVEADKVLGLSETAFRHRIEKMMRLIVSLSSF